MWVAAVWSRLFANPKPDRLTLEAGRLTFNGAARNRDNVLEAKAAVLGTAK